MISSQWIITAAHCIYNKEVQYKNTIIRLGDWNIRSEKEDYTHEDFEIEEIQVHKKFQRKFFLNDIGAFHFYPFEFYFYLF